jgi:hypothetical protein
MASDPITTDELIEARMDEPATGRQRPRKPDRAVAAECAQLQDGACPLDTRQQVQQLALVW